MKARSVLPVLLPSATDFQDRLGGSILLTVSAPKIVLKRAEKLPVITPSVHEALNRVRDGLMQAARAADIAAECVKLRRLTLPSRDRPYADHPLVSRTLALIREVDALGMSWSVLDDLHAQLLEVSDQFLRAGLSMDGRVPEPVTQPTLEEIVAAEVARQIAALPAHSGIDAVSGEDDVDVGGFVDGVLLLPFVEEVSNVAA